MDQGGESFKDFVRRLLVAAIPADKVEILVSDEPLEMYFRRAFTDVSFLTNRAGKEGKFNYEILEKIGDRILGASFQLWLFEIMGAEVTIPQTYADMEKDFTNTEYLNYLATNLGFDRFIRVANDGNKITDKIREDVFEAFIAAIVVSADKYVMQDIGLAYAKRWIYQVYNTYARDRIDPLNPSKYVNFRSRVNEVWQFNGWGNQNYVTTGEARGAKEIGVRRLASASLFGPMSLSFPEELRNRQIGEGEGDTIDEARENAAKAALTRLEINYPELKGLEFEFSALETSRLKRTLKNNPVLQEKVIKILQEKSETYQSLAIRKMRLFGAFTVQFRVKIDGIWRNGARARSDVSEAEAIQKAFEIFVSKAGDGKI